MDSLNTQLLFFQHLKTQVPAHLSMVDEVADLLEISIDSAYRRIRAEKPISLDEVTKLCTQFNISLDKFLHLKNDSYLFSGKLTNASDHYFGEWLKETLTQLQYMATFEKKHLYYLNKDVPFFSHFQIPELAAFKFFCWMKSILHYDQYRGKKFSLSERIAPFEDMGKKIVHYYNLIPTTEIWEYESINATIRQIEFYYASDIFESREDALLMYEKMEELVNHYELQAELGKKFNIGEMPDEDSVDFMMYNNELVVGDNSVLVEVGNMKIAFLNHSVINYLSTRDERFTTYIYESIRNLIQKSTQISKTGEKDRSRFFNRLREKIAVKKRAVKAFA
jgi:hypothetical protein